MAEESVAAEGPTGVAAASDQWKRPCDASEASV